MTIEASTKCFRPDLVALKVWIENGRNPQDQPSGYDVSDYLTPKGRELLAVGVERINRLEGNKREKDERLQKDWYFESWMIDPI